jgi:hypothetical protein
MITESRPVPGIQHFDYGARVVHQIYGEGTVIAPDRYTRADMHRVRFDCHGVVRVIASRLWAGR